MKQFTIIMIAAMSAFSIQTIAQENQSMPEKQEFHQIFLDEPIQKINKVNYNDEEGGEIEHRLSPDGKAIQMLNYKGTGGVKAEVVKIDGTVEEIVRSKCYIHSLQEL